MVLINALNSEEEPLAFFRHLIATVQPTISAFNCTSFFHTSKVGNTIAHNLAKYAKHVKSLSVWIEDILSHLHDVLATDYGCRGRFLRVATCLPLEV